MESARESERFSVEDETDGWLTIIRRAGGEMSVQWKELRELAALLAVFAEHEGLSP